MPGTCLDADEEGMVNRDILQGQKLLGWVLLVMGLLLLILIGLAQSVAGQYSLPVLGAFANWNPSMVGIVAWLLLAAGYVFVLSSHLEDRLREIEGRVEERINRLTRELAGLQQSVGQRPGSQHSESTPDAGPADLGS
jgi:thiosulfate reductase cytochrome b subunit